MCLLSHDSVLRAVGQSNVVRLASSHDDVASSRLPRHITPVKYSLTVSSDIDNWTFQGYTSIQLEVLEATKYINFHTLELLYRDIKLYSGWLDSHVENITPLARPDVAVAVKDLFLFEENQRGLIELESEIPAGKYTLECTYSGDINDHLAGFYRSTYRDDNNVEHRIACTQFEATDARRCLPCWDEPSYKAVFQCTLISPKKYTTLCNTSVVRTEMVPVGVDRAFGLPSAGAAPFSSTKLVATPELDAANIVTPTLTVADTVALVFAPSPKMCTYLLAFVIGEFDYVEKVNSLGVLMRVYTPPGKSHQGEYALDISSKALEILVNTFNAGYPMDKCDLVALPAFAAGAMENWGLITFRSTHVLVTDSTTSGSLKQIARTVTHEVVHHMAGNLVSMYDWSQLYLNEAFARYGEFFILNEIFPEWNIYELFVADPYALALDRDAVSSSHAIETKADTPDEINAMFDAISYAKGACILRNFHTQMGAEFVRGVSNYVGKFKYDNATSDDLWSTLEATWKEACVDRFDHAITQWDSSITTQEVTSIAKPWTLEANYPVVTVTKVADNQYRLEQESVISAPVYADAEGKADARLWPILMQVANKERSYVKNVHFNQKSVVVTVDCADEVIFNAHGTCLMHIIYKDGLPKSLADGLIDGSVAPIDRLNILNDAVFAYKIGAVSYQVFIDTLALYTAETHIYVLLTLEAAISELLVSHRSAPYVDSIKAHLGKMFVGLFDKVGRWNTEDKANLFVRSVVIRILLKLNVEEVKKEGKKLVNALIRANSKVITNYIEMYGVDHLVAGEENPAKLPTNTVLTPTFTFDGIPADFQSSVLSVLAGSTEKYPVGSFEVPALTILKTILVSTTDIEAKLKAQAAMVSLPTSEALKSAVECLILSGVVPMQDLPYTLRSFLVGSLKGHAVTWNYIKSNWTEFMQKVRRGNAVACSPLLYAVMQRVADPELIQELEKFFTDNQSSEGAEGIKRGLLAMKHNLAVFETQSPEISKYY